MGSALSSARLSLAISATTLVVTVIYYYKMVVITELTTEATLFNTLYAEYTTPQFTDALRAVEDFDVNTPLTAKQIVCKKPEERLWDKKFEHDWQRVYHWYQKLVYFHRMGLLGDRFYAEFPGPYRAKQFVKDVEPFALHSCMSHGGANCTEIFDYLRVLYTLPASEKVDCTGKAAKSDKSKSAKKEEL